MFRARSASGAALFVHIEKREIDGSMAAKELIRTTLRHFGYQVSRVRPHQRTRKCSLRRHGALLG
jgi:hypothetical protein